MPRNRKKTTALVELPISRCFRVTSLFTSWTEQEQAFALWLSEAGK
jgi:hypothetical protein